MILRIINFIAIVLFSSYAHANTQFFQEGLDLFNSKKFNEAKI